MTEQQHAPGVTPGQDSSLADPGHPAHPPPPAGHLVRRPTDDDLPAIAALYERVAVRSARGTTGRGALRTLDDLRRTWAGRGDDALVVERTEADGSTSLAGYLEFHEDLDPWTPALDLYAEGRVDPRADARLVGAFLHSRALARALRAASHEPDLPTALRTALVDPSPAAVRWFADRRMHPERHLLRLRIDLDRGLPPPEPPPGIALAPASAVPDAAVHAALVASFADHHLGTTDDLDTWRALHRHHLDTETALSLVAVTDAGEVVGVALARAEDDLEPGLAVVTDLGVVPTWRGRGLATTLLRGVFARAAATGAVSVGLEVDDVTVDGALRLYERAGMEVVHHVWVLTTGPLTPAADPAPGRPG